MQITRTDTTTTLQHAHFTLTIRHAQQQIRYTVQSSHGTFTPCEGVLGDIQCDQQAIAWQALTVADPELHVDGTTTVAIVADAQGLQLQLTIQLFAHHPMLRTWGTLHNLSTQVCTVNDCAIVHLLFPQAPLYLFHVDQFSWVYRRDFFSQHQSQIWPGRTPIEIRMGSYPSHYDGATSCAWFAMRPPPHDTNPQHPNQGSGVVCGIEFNGKSRVHAWATPTTTTVRNSIDTLAHQLAPDGVFEVPGMFIGGYTGDWDEAGYVTQRFAEAHISPAIPDNQYPWVQYNSWKYGQEINEAQQLAVIDICHELGIEVVVMDLGWARTIGDWHPNSTKFPRGLAPLAARAKQYGMRFGVHIAMAQCAPDAPIAQAHPEWLIHTYDDYFGAGILCFGHQPCRDWIIAQISRLIESEGIDYIIQDGEDMVKYCPRTDHSHAPGDSNYANSQSGLDIVIGTIRAKYPHVVLENCEDGGMMMTYKMAQLYHTSITVDNIATYATRQGIYGASYPFSPRYSVRYMEDDPTPYTLRSAIFGGPLILMQRITDWNARQRQDALLAINEYKRYRTLIRDGKVIHLLPPRTNLNNLGWGWDAIQSVAVPADQSVVMVYRAMGDTPSRVIYPRGLQADAMYHIAYEDSLQQWQRRGSDIMRYGIVVALPEFSAEILRLDRLESRD